MSQLIQMEKADGVAVVTVVNPPMNVLNTAVARELLQVFRSLIEDDEVVSVVLTGAGERAFMAGADIKEFPSALGQIGAAETLALGLHELMNTIDHFPKPTIAALHGFVFGGGMELALACDMRICDEATQLGLPEIKLGIFPGAGGTQRLPRLIGEAKAKEIIFTGEPISAELADKVGLVNRVVEKGQSKTAATMLAKQIAKRSLQALGRIKRAIDQGGEMPLEQAVRLEAKLFGEVFQTADAREGISAFIEKREAVFKHQ